MAKLKNIIKQLSDKDYQTIYDQLVQSNAEKSAYLLKGFRERQLSDSKIMAELELQPNAFYTMRSRLSQKIEDYLVEQMESPRTDILKKVANLNEVLFTKKRTLSIATLKKLEKELQDYDLASELTVVYKSLKKMHINSPDYFQYSQLYNRHVAYMLAVDKADDLLADYFKKYGNYYLTGDETDRMGLTLMLREMQNVARLYESHRLFVYESMMLVFHRLFVEREENLQSDEASIEDIFTRVQTTFESYPLDPVYYHLNLVFEFLKLEYYNHYKVYKQSEKYFEEVNDAVANLMMNYPYYTFSAQFLVSKLQRHLRLGSEKDLFVENENLFEDIETDPLDVPRHVIYMVYRALSAYYVERYEEAARLLNNLLNDVSFKRYPLAQLEVKALLAVVYGMLRDVDLVTQLVSSISRQSKLIEDKAENLMLIVKILKIATSEAKREKPKKILVLIQQFSSTPVSYFSPTRFIRMDDQFIERLTALDV
ncbi:MAG: hypothetical protein JNL17_15015 [Cyclobacteriaceae bacterium]|nr:hypothetical protein [Cyclobacteriaceae bacterium]